MKSLFYGCLCLIGLLSCRQSTLFDPVSSSHSGIDFVNQITENDSINPLDMVNIYNGGGVGVGDFNNDGWQDIYFTGNMVSNRLYLNKGSQGSTFAFRDVTREAGVEGMGRWGRGVAVVDINNDGWMDLYVCNTIAKDSLKRRNLLYVNQRIDKEGVPVFKEMAEAYGLDAHGQSTMATFFDYDNDGDLDLYLTVNEAMAEINPGKFGVIKGGVSQSRGKLYRNDWKATENHPIYTDVSVQAGVTLDGYGHTATVVDINLDGWKDISVANDFLSNNILYVNNGQGRDDRRTGRSDTPAGAGPTFTDRAREYFKHTSLNAMGQDISDINNDGLADLVELDMNPEDNYRKKMMMGANNYASYLNFDLHGYQHQYVRNTLQLNQGPRVGPQDSVGSPVFSEIGFMSGIAQTDWSWTPLLTDFNNDSYRDLVVTNGYPRDVTDHDFIAYRDEQPYELVAKQKLLDKIPVVKLHNYAFVNNGDLSFGDVTKEWGLTKPTFSNGAAYADFDNDGDLDIVINNINDEALLYRNTARDQNKDRTHYLQIKFIGDGQNLNGLGAFATIYYDHGKQQVYEHTPYRGYLSTHQLIAHFGLNEVTRVDSVVIKWPTGRKQVLTNVKADQLLSVSILNAKTSYSWEPPKIAGKALFRDITQASGLQYRHTEFDFIDFNIQKLLPHKLSEYSPALAAGDVDGNGFDDLVMGGNAHDPAQVFLQQANGKFVQQALSNEPATTDYKDEGILLFDANGDKALDVYIARGGYKQAPNSPAYQDVLYLNDGKGRFTVAADALPRNLTSKLCVRAVDYNKDGQLDLFVSGRVDPWHYPRPVSSFIFRNDSRGGRVKFTDVTSQVAPSLTNVGLVCDALFTDFDNDTWPDLILAGEWMPITFLKNEQGRFKSVTQATGIGDKLGWWNTIVAGDFRHTGRIDYVVGNTGLNTFYQASESYPVHITADDFDKNGSYSAIPSLFLPDQQGVKKEFPAHGREDLIKQMNSMKKKFTDFKSLAVSSMDEILTPEQRKTALRLTVNTTQSCYLRNDGNGKFTMIPLPKQAQMSILNGMVVEDYDEDGNLDVAITGNDYGTDVSIGRHDALNGLLLKGDGRGHFQPQSMLESGIYIPGNGKALVKLRMASGTYGLAASQNNGPLKLFERKRAAKTINLQPSDRSAVITYTSGKRIKQEFYYGASFLSQSGRFIRVDENMTGVVITDSQGKERSLPLASLTNSTAQRQHR